MSKPKILILTAPMGGGHLAAAKAISEAISEEYGDTYEVVVADVFKDMKVIWSLDKLTIPIYAGSVKLLNSYPYKLFYKMSDTYAEQFHRFFNSLLLEQFEKYLKKEQPDLLVSTFWAFGYAAEKLVKTNKIKSVPIISIVTDAGDVHRMWLISREDAILVSTPETIEYAVELGVPREKLHYLGFPIDKKYRHLPSKQAARALLGLEDRPTVLLTGGGMGLSNKLVGLARRLAKQETGAQYLFIGGRNEALTQELREIEFKDQVRVFGFVDNAHELLAASDFIVGKAGWLTLYEAMICKRPIIIIDVIPGQEEPNAQFVEEHGLGMVVKNIEKAAKVIQEMVRDNQKVVQYEVNFSKLGLDPNAGQKIARFIAEFLPPTD